MAHEAELKSERAASPQSDWGGRLQVGVDVGGTFTDVVALGPAGLQVYKLPTSGDPSEAVLEGLAKVGGRAKHAASIAHATTLATNALLTRAGLARTALITNTGFRDVLEIGRQRRPEPYDMATRRPPPLVRRRDRLTVLCRVRADRSIAEPLDEKGGRAVARAIVARGFESVAICFLNSYVNPAHERRMRSVLRREGYEGHISVSSEVDRAYREYERTSTTVVNACLAPLMAGYLSRLTASLRRAGIRASVNVMSSDGGMGTVASAVSRPVSVIESGPAAGVVASCRLARELALEKVITLDMGGTTAKAGAVIGGEAQLTEEFEAAGRTHSGRSITGSGYPVRGRFVDLAEVSAGGGTIVWADEARRLVVGPRSAGSLPGPACYGRGGAEPTVTDANLLAGRVSSKGLLGGTMPLYPRLSRRAFAKASSSVGATEAELTRRVIRLANDQMSRAISIVSLERGRDPRDSVLVAFGGAGPAHACDIAESLGIRSIVVPAHAGLFSAYGLLAGDASRTYVFPVMRPARALKARFGAFEARILKELHEEGLDASRFRRSVELRYEGQSHELLLPYAGDPSLARSFHERHRELYGYSSDDAVEAVNARVTAVIGMSNAPLPSYPARAATTGRGRSERRTAWVGGKTQVVPVYQREGLSKGRSGEGPCIIEEYDATLVVNPSWGWTAETYGTRLSR